MFTQSPKNVFGLVAFILGLSSNVSIAQVDQHKRTCGPSESVSAAKAFLDAKSGLLKAIESFKSPSSSDANRQSKWFGAMNSTSGDSLRKVYEGGLAQVSFAQVWCPLTNDVSFRWDVGDLAAVHASAPGAIFLTPKFFSLPVTGADSRMGTIIHELTHLVGVGLRPEIYGVPKVKALAQSDPNRAKNNSDSFQYYVEDLVFGLP